LYTHERSEPTLGESFMSDVTVRARARGEKQGQLRAAFQEINWERSSCPPLRRAQASTLRKARVSQANEG
jgi:hypothetical protein